jgi:hypothetical protein
VHSSNGMDFFSFFLVDVGIFFVFQTFFFWNFHIIFWDSYFGVNFKICVYIVNVFYMVVLKFLKIHCQHGLNVYWEGSNLEIGSKHEMHSWMHKLRVTNHITKGIISIFPKWCAKQYRVLRIGLWKYIWNVFNFNKYFHIFNNFITCKKYLFISCIP